MGVARDAHLRSVATDIFQSVGMSAAARTASVTSAIAAVAGAAAKRDGYHRCGNEQYLFGHSLSLIDK